MGAIWDYVVGLHVAAEVGSLVVFYGVIAAGACFVVLQVLQVRTNRRAREAHERTRDLLSRVEGLEALPDRVSDRLVEKEKSLEKKMELVQSSLAKEVRETASSLRKRTEELEADHRQIRMELETLRQRLGQMEGRIPDLYEQLEEFRDTLGRIFQSELSSVFDSFDSSVSAVLGHMKDQLHMGIAQIDSIEGMVSSRQKAERSLLASGESEDSAAQSRKLQPAFADLESEETAEQEEPPGEAGGPEETEEEPQSEGWETRTASSEEDTPADDEDEDLLRWPDAA